MSNPPGYSHVVEVTGPHRVVYFAGQTGTDANGKVVGTDFRAQAVQVFENIKIALASVGAGFEHVVKMTAYHTNLDANAAIYRDVRGSYFPNKAALPGHTLAADFAARQSGLSARGGGDRDPAGEGLAASLD